MRRRQHEQPRNWPICTPSHPRPREFTPRKGRRLASREKSEEEQAVISSAPPRGRRAARPRARPGVAMATFDRPAPATPRAERELQREIARSCPRTRHARAQPSECARREARRASRDYAGLVRGEPATAGKVVPRRFLEILSPDPKNRPAGRRAPVACSWRCHRRSEEPADRPRHGQPSWQQHWGAGFVDTPDDLGTCPRRRPTPSCSTARAHVIENHWSIKSLHRIIVLSAA